MGRAVVQRCLALSRYVAILMTTCFRRAGAAQRPVQPLQATATAETATESSVNTAGFDEIRSDFITSSGLPDYYCILGVRRVAFCMGSAKVKTTNLHKV